MNTITWTAPMLTRFKEAYGQAVTDRQAEFNFDGNEFVTKYAKYLIAHLSSLDLSSKI